MPAQLDPEERYVIAYYRSTHMASAWWAWLIVRLAFAGLFAYGLCAGDHAVMTSAFVTLLALELYSAAKQPRFMRATRSALEKLERRIDELEQRNP